MIVVKLLWDLATAPSSNGTASSVSHDLEAVQRAWYEYADGVGVGVGVGGGVDRTRLMKSMQTFASARCGSAVDGALLGNRRAELKVDWFGDECTLWLEHVEERGNVGAVVLRTVQLVVHKNDTRRLLRFLESHRTLS
jgi:hypothetical protein